MGGGFCVLLCAVAWNQPAVHSPACQRPIRHSPCHLGQPALRTSHFALRTSALGLRRSARRTGGRENGMPLRISEPERSEAPRAGAGERESGRREPGFGFREAGTAVHQERAAVKPEGVLPSWSSVSFRSRPAPPGVRTRQPDLTQSREVRHAAKEILCGRRLGVLLCAVAWNRPAVHSPACQRPIRHGPCHLGNPHFALRTSHFALRRWAFAVRPGRTGAIVISEPERSEAPRAGPENGSGTGAVKPEGVLPSWSAVLLSVAPCPPWSEDSAV